MCFVFILKPTQTYRKVASIVQMLFFSDSFENNLPIWYSIMFEYFRIYFLHTRAFSYITTVQPSKLRNCINIWPPCSPQTLYLINCSKMPFRAKESSSESHVIFRHHVLLVSFIWNSSQFFFDFHDLYTFEDYDRVVS